MVTERRGVEAQQVHDLVDGQAMKVGRDRRALHRVAGIQQDAVVAVGVLPLDHRGEIGESPVVIVARRQARVQIVGMENGKRPGFRSPATSRAAATAPAGTGSSCASTCVVANAKADHGCVPIEPPQGLSDYAQYYAHSTHRQIATRIDGEPFDRLQVLELEQAVAIRLNHYAYG